MILGNNPDTVLIDGVPYVRGETHRLYDILKANTAYKNELLSLGYSFRAIEELINNMED